MNLLDYYPDLVGSHGKCSIRLSKVMLDELCDLVVVSFKDRIQHLRIVPAGHNRFRLKAELSNQFLHFLGSIGLRVLREEGVEFHIEYPAASRKNPTIEGTIDTTIFGHGIAIQAIATAINDGVQIRDMIVIHESEWLGWVDYRVFVSINPFLLLERFLPSGMGQHFTKVRWKATAEELYFDFSWKHTGMNVSRDFAKGDRDG